jgi:CRP-like cAMP-binding protein
LRIGWRGARFETSCAVTLEVAFRIRQKPAGIGTLPLILRGLNAAFSRYLDGAQGSLMMLHNALNEPQNRLLASLSNTDYERLRSHLEPVCLEYKRSLYDANKPIDFVYFIESGVASLVNTMRNGDAAEVGTIGNEGIVGLPIVFGDKQAPASVYMQVPGAGLRMKASLFSQELLQSTSMRTAMLHYAQAFFNQVAQSAACAHFHSLEQRCCRWLLMTHDRMESDEFRLTQEFLAMMLGVRRAGVTVAAGALQRAGLIRYKHGRVTILDRDGLKKLSCECYDIGKREFDRLLGETKSVSKRPKKEAVLVFDLAWRRRLARGWQRNFSELSGNIFVGTLGTPSRALLWIGTLFGSAWYADAWMASLIHCPMTCSMRWTSF